MARHNKSPADETLREVDTGKSRRARRRRRFGIRLLILITVITLVVCVVINWETLAPSAIMLHINDWLSGGSGGGFPVDVSGSAIFQMENADGCTVLLSDTYVTMINRSGAEVMRRTHPYTDPQLRTAGKYVLVAERGGKRLQLETRAKTVQTITTSYDILTSAVHKSGRVAVVTGSDQGYNAEISVYTAAGELIYHRLCGSLIADISFSPDGKQLAVAAIGAEKGAMVSTVEVLSLGSDDSEALYAHSETDVLLYRIAYLSDSMIAAVGDSAVWMYQPRRDNCTLYALNDGMLQAFAIGDSGVLAVTQPYGSTTGGTAVGVKTDGTAAFTESFEGVCRDVAADGSGYTLLAGSGLYQFSGRGLTGSRTVAADSRLVSLSGNRVMVLGLTSLVQYSAPTRLNETD